MLNRNSKMSLLKQVPLFAACSKRELNAIARVSDEADAAGGEAIVTEGDETRDFYVIVSGTADVSREGKRLATLKAGDFFGEMAILLSCPRTATVTATSPVHLLVMTEPDFFRIVHEFGGLHRKVITALGERLAPTAL